MTRVRKWLLIGTFGQILVIPIILIVVYLIAPVFAPNQFQEFHKEVPYAHITSIAVARLFPSGPPPTAGTPEAERMATSSRFHEYVVDGSWRSIEAHHCDDVASALLDKGNFDNLGLAECFFPGMAMRCQSDAGDFDVLICLECEQVKIIPTTGSHWHIPLSPLGVKSAKALYVDLFLLHRF